MPQAPTTAVLDTIFETNNGPTIVMIMMIDASQLSSTAICGHWSICLRQTGSRQRPLEAEWAAKTISDIMSNDAWSEDNLRASRLSLFSDRANSKS